MLAMKKGQAASRSPDGNRVILTVFVSEHCPQCPEARALAHEFQKEFVALDVRVIDLDQPGARKPAKVFAVPTFLLNDKIISLGTPYSDELRDEIRAALNDASGRLNSPPSAPRSRKSSRVRFRHRP